MGFYLRSFINKLSSFNEILHIKEVVSVKYEIARFLRKFDEGPLLIFHKIKESSFKVIGNILSKRSRITLALDVKNLEEAYRKLLKACSNPTKPKVYSDAAFMELEFDNLRKLPILLHYEKDGGPYITSSIVFARDPEQDFQNASYHRLMVIDEKRMAIRIVPRHLHTICKKYFSKNEDVPIAIVIGTHPVVMISAASSPPYGINELYVANTLANNTLEVTSLENGLEVPRDAEIVILGRIVHNKKVKEGPFVDVTGTYDIVRDQPLVEVDKIYAREDALYHALLPAGSEHRILMGFFREALIWDYASRIAKVKAVRLTKGGCGWLHCVISIKKDTEGDAKNVIMAAFAAHPSLKLVIVVDDDINIDDPYEIEWAIATRFQADRDLVIIKEARGSSLDPSADQVNLLTTKVGIDATKTLRKPSIGFEKAKIPS